MIFPRAVGRGALSKLPHAIWIPAGGNEPAFYRGSPLEIVQEMADDMQAPSLEAAVGVILEGLAKNRRVTILLPKGLQDEALSRIFIYALLETGVGREMPKA